MALVVLSKIEQRLDAVRAVLAGADVTAVAAGLGVHRSSVHRWTARYLTDQLTGLVDRSHRPASCPHQLPTEVEVAVAEMRRKHPRWGSRRIRMELLRRSLPGLLVPAERTIDRILIRQGLLAARPQKRPRESYVRFERPGPMQLWGIDIIGGIQLVEVTTGVVREAKLVTEVDDHSRFCVMAAVVERATSRAVCLAFAAALARFGAPQEVITDNGKQFTDRFGKGGEVLFDKICRRNGINHLLTAPFSPNQNGKVERFHGTLRPDFLTDAGPFESLDAAQVAVDTWVEHYRTGPGRSVAARRPRTSRRTSDGVGVVACAQWGGRVGQDRAAVREHVYLRPAVLARTGPRRPGRHVLGRLRHGASVDRRHPDQDRPIAPDSDRPGPPRR